MDVASAETERFRANRFRSDVELAERTIAIDQHPVYVVAREDRGSCVSIDSATRHRDDDGDESISGKAGTRL